jgi:hypothetical protein
MASELGKGCGAAVVSFLAAVPILGGLGMLITTGHVVTDDKGVKVVQIHLMQGIVALALIIAGTLFVAWASRRLRPSNVDA